MFIAIILIDIVVKDIKYWRDNPKILFFILGFFVSLSRVYKIKVPDESEINALKFIPKIGFKKVKRNKLAENAITDILR